MRDLTESAFDSDGGSGQFGPRGAPRVVRWVCAALAVAAAASLAVPAAAASEPEGGQAAPECAAVGPAARGETPGNDPNLTDISTLAELNAIRDNPQGNYELVADLDFDTNANGSADAGDAFWNGGAGWAPIRFGGTLEGNGHMISNLFIDDDEADLGLFGRLEAGAVVRDLGLVSVDISGDASSGALAATNEGTISDSYATGTVRGGIAAGGLVGWNEQRTAKVVASYFSGTVEGIGVGGLVAGNWGEIIASCSDGTVTNTKNLNSLIGTGGLVGTQGEPGSVTASWSAAAVSAAAGTMYVGGLVGNSGAPVVASFSVGSVSGDAGYVGPLLGGVFASPTDSYWDTDVNSGLAYRGEYGTVAAPESWRWHGGGGHSTAALQAPTGYTGIYARWNVDLDGDSTPDDPWSFGAADDYPTLKYRRAAPPDPAPVDETSPTTTPTTTPAPTEVTLGGPRPNPDVPQCAAVGPAARGQTPGNDPNLADISTLAELNAIRDNPQGGYELVADLDFDTNANGSADAGDAYWNEGAGWAPIRFGGTFEGNGHTISNLHINAAGVEGGTNNAGLFRWLEAGAVVRNVGLVSVDINGNSVVGALAANNFGAITDSYVTGTVRGQERVGGLVGWTGSTSKITASYFSGSVEGYEVGGLVANNVGLIAASCSDGTVANTANNDDAFDSAAGGLVGYHGHPGRVIASRSAAAVSAASGTDRVGGLIGMSGAAVTASYSAGPVTGDGSHIGGLIGRQWTRPTVSYSDTMVNPHLTDHGDGLPTVVLQATTAYDGVYGSWNVDLDGDHTPDDPWDFGTANDYPTLKYRRTAPAVQPNPDNTAQAQQATQAVPGPVLNLTVSAAAKRITVTWDAPATGDAPERYIVHLRPQGGKKGSGKTKKIDAAKTSVTFKKLKRGTAYNIWVRAQNTAGKSDRTHTTATTTD